jgi:hypothetical protein
MPDYGVTVLTKQQVTVMIVATLIGLLTGCASSGAPRPGTPMAHVHGLAMQGSDLLLATHDGLLRQRPGQGPIRVSDQPFDVMGFAVAGDRLLASGHPAPGSKFPSDLGLGQSTDGGRTWRPVSLLGDRDFHRIQSAGDRVWALTADDALMLSADGGQTWTTSPARGLLDLAVNLQQPRRIIGATAQGAVTSDDAGMNFAPLSGSPRLALVAWGSGGAYGVTADGVLMHSTDGRTAWSKRATVSGAPTALWATGDEVAVATSRGVSTSTDGGRTFVQRVSADGS